MPQRLLVLLLLVAASLRGEELPVVQLDTGPTLRIAVTGDIGSGADAIARGIAALHAADPFDAIVITGDNFYPCGVVSEEDERWSLVMPLTRIGPPVFPVLGNHDFCGKADPDAQVRATARIANWRFPARQYVVRSGIAELLFIDTTPYVRGRGDAPREAIDEAFSSEKARWRVVIGHHPILSSGYHGYFPRSEVRRMRALLPTLRSAAADLYVAGHDHHVEILGGSPMHLTSGAGSEPIRPVLLRSATLFPTRIGREPIGFAVVEVTAEALRIRPYDATGRPRGSWIEGQAKGGK